LAGRLSKSGYGKYLHHLLTEELRS
jgi:hypothetical protein